MELVDYLPVMIQILLAVVIAAAILIASHIFGQRARGNYVKDSAYECGMLEEGKPHPKFSVKFYVVAMLFILFDIEMVFMIPWVMVYRELLAVGVLDFWPILFFLFILTLGLVYEMKKKGLEWER
ncbi:NADH-quinone oxidoreductase subunit A [Cerasicoccus maritimus]|uniref:NADH-quinone oxidoreductase subunit A n=1 Tax=Cerasicoccus maritimus TaxID=490089 RepID=UPI002852BA9C|nr:NADH-quinone oxidoreductase subunit A [Cerasicoccus maritimus]